MGETTLTAEPGIPQIVMTREFDAPRELMLRAYTEPELIEQWWGPRKYATIVDRFDLRHGGEWRFLNRDDDGNEYGFHGVFHGVPSVDGGIVQTWEYEGAPGHVHLETATFEEHDGGTRLVLTASYPTVEARDAPPYLAAAAPARRESPVMSGRGLAWVGLGVYVALTLTAIALVILQGAAADSLGALGFAGFAVVGTLIAVRRPGNAVGWLLLVVAIVFAFGNTGEAYAESASNPARVAVAWVTSWSTNVWFSLVIVILPLLFPDGRLLSRRWRLVLWLAIVDLVLAAGGGAFRPGRLDLQQTSGIENPLGVDGGLPQAALDVDNVLGGATVALAAVAVVVRFRRSHGAERQQLKWFALVGVLAAMTLSVAVVGSAIGGDEFAPVAVVGWLTGLAMLGIGLPVAMGIAIFRHRLYDVDVVIRRTLVYGALTATLGATYLALVLLVGLAVGQSNVAIALSTLAVAALFRPLRARIQGAVDQRFYRRRYDATRTLEAFGARLRDELDLEALGADVRRVVAETVQPAHVSLWLRSER
jgi:uncharacterized protein YndB with AHSA1/START domain